MGMLSAPDIELANLQQYADAGAAAASESLQYSEGAQNRDSLIAFATAERAEWGDLPHGVRVAIVLGLILIFTLSVLKLFDSVGFLPSPSKGVREAHKSVSTGLAGGGVQAAVSASV